MKQSIRITLAILLVHTLVASGISHSPRLESQTDFPKKVSAILENSCHYCHTSGAKAEKAAEALDFTIWEEYKLTKKISLLTKICEVAESGDMPPGKYVKQHPEKALSETEIKTICNWTKKESERLIK